MMITDTKTLREALRNGPYAWPGRYPIYFMCEDGDDLHPHCVKETYRQVAWAVRHNIHRDQWRVVAADVNWEDPSLYCAHCNKRIESAYAEDEVQS